MTTHPVAELFPMLAPAELDALAADIKANGQQLPIVCQGDVLLDGRNRLAACRLAGVEPVIQSYTGSDPVAYIIGANLHRRHLSESQRAGIAAKLANLADGQHKSPTPNGGGSTQVSQSDAAKLLNVSPRSVQRAARVQREAPELAAKVQAGEITVGAAVAQIEAKKTTAAETPKPPPAKEEPPPPTPEQRKNSNAMQHAAEAINALRKISKKDPVRAEALRTVGKWVTDNE